MKAKRKLSFTAVLLLIGFVPLLLSSIIICLITSGTVTTQLTESVYSKLNVTTESLWKYYQYDIDAGNEIPYEHDYVDMLKDKDIDMTIFVGDTRYITSTLKTDGSRNEGTQMDPAIWARVQNGETVEAKNVPVGVKKYFVCYMPIKGTDGKVMGAAWAGQPVDDVNAEINKIMIALILTIVISLIIFGVIIFIISRRVVNSINDVVHNMDTLAGGDLVNRKEMRSAIKEIEAINFNFTKLCTKLSEVISDAKNAALTTLKEATSLADTAHQISDTADGVSEAVQEMAKGATEQADSVQKSTENIGMLSDAIQNVSDNAESLASNAAYMNDASQQSAGALEKLQQNMNKMGEAVKIISDTMKETNEAVNKVNEKVDGITGIASQTNLLALNASIEAARAGEQGRGFAVVAEEIGKLASESGDTAGEIRDEMSQLLVHANDASQKAVEVTSLENEVITVLGETVEIIRGLIDNVSGTVDGVNTISGLTEECNANKDQILDAMSSLSAISEENAASTQETSASMQELNATVNVLAESAGNLNGVAKQLEEELNFFKI
ncbi:MAG: cache domain-containing protein [Lachnospiraceae bacterium]|nr:cache domain-containing protein [Lachnospiraceae bacterium]